MALRDQLSINQPKGIKEGHQKLIDQYKDPHVVEHLMMECIVEMIYISKKNNTTIESRKLFELHFKSDHKVIMSIDQHIESHLSCKVIDKKTISSW